MTQNTKIPFLDLITPHQELQDELMDVFRAALQTAGFVNGPAVEGFEREFSAYCDAKYAVGVGSGTDALRLALIAAGVSPGDSVITVPLTFIATTEAITQAGALPEFVDIDEQNCTIDPEKLRGFLENSCEMVEQTGQLRSRRTRRPVRAVIPVHLYGQMADMDPILALAERYNLIVIEDACQAHGAEYFSQRETRWRKAGSIGRAAAFSFYPGKNLGACGEAGAVTTNDEALAHKVRILRDHGQAQKYCHEIEGYNSRLDNIQAGILQVKLRHLTRWNEQRRQVARLYNELLQPLKGSAQLLHEPKWLRGVYHLYVVLVADRDALRQHLAAARIDTGIHYPVPLHLQNAYACLGYRAGDFPVSEHAAARVLSLPMYPGLAPAQQRHVVRSIQRFVARGQAAGSYSTVFR
jgi:dTDP-4-amino-4,6-dideoxygalactose transaminase